MFFSNDHITIAQELEKTQKMSFASMSNVRWQCRPNVSEA